MRGRRKEIFDDMCGTSDGKHGLLRQATVKFVTFIHDVVLTMKKVISYHFLLYKNI